MASLSLEHIMIFIYSIYNTLYNLIINWLVIHINDNRLEYFCKPIKFYESFIDFSPDENEPIENDDYTKIEALCNINKTLTRYKKNNKYNSDKFIIIKAFLFNLKDEKITDNYTFTNKLTLIYNTYESLNLKTIRLLSKEQFRYVYIFYKNNENVYKIRIFDLFEGYELIDKSRVIFNNMKL